MYIPYLAIGFRRRVGPRVSLCQLRLKNKGENHTPTKQIYFNARTLVGETNKVWNPGLGETIGDNS